MSHYQLPRLHFRGEFRANVATANNDDLSVAFPDQQFVDVARVKIDTLGMDDGEFQTWLRETAPPFGIRGGWNLYGDCYCDFPNTTIHATHPANSHLIVDAAEDPFIGASLILPQRAVMVDLNPEGTRSTQIFCDELALTGDASMRIGGRPSRFYSHDVTRRNLSASGFAAFAATWYAAIAPEEMSVTAGGSPVLESFQIAHEGGAGLFVAFSTYLLAPRIPQQQLAEDFAAGRTTPNPAFGRLVGTLGIWAGRELKSAPVQRRLVAGALMQHDQTEFRLNPAYVRPDAEASRVTIDLMNAFPEIDESLQKVNVGSVHLAVDVESENGIQRHDIGEVPYDRQHYETQAGLVDLACTDDVMTKIQQGSLVLYQTATGAKILQEAPYTIATDDRCVYLQQGETADIRIRLCFKGRPPSSEQEVRLRQYRTTNRVFALSPPAERTVAAPDSVATSLAGEGVFAISGESPGTCLIALIAPGEADSSMSSFCTVRVLPSDSYDDIPDNQLSFQFIYGEVLRYYHLLYPAMSERFDLSNGMLVELMAQAILDRIAPSIWDRSSYMPITRELSDGKRRLLERWCKLVIGMPTDGPTA